MNKIETEVLHKEIDLIQACITRMAQNSFLIKGWAISIVAVVLALADKAINPVLLSVILVIPLISFWYLDAFFLRTERMYRQMYAWVLAKRKDGEVDLLYDLNPNRFKETVDSRFRIMWSETLRCFYGVPVLIVSGIIIWQCHQSCCAIKQDTSSNSPLHPSSRAQVATTPTIPRHTDNSESPCATTYSAGKRTSASDNTASHLSRRMLGDTNAPFSTQTNQSNAADLGN